MPEKCESGLRGHPQWTKGLHCCWYQLQLWRGYYQPGQGEFYTALCLLLDSNTILIIGILPSVRSIWPIIDIIKLNLSIFV